MKLSQGNVQAPRMQMYLWDYGVSNKDYFIQILSLQPDLP
jgi:hypothetical protein